MYPVVLEKTIKFPVSELIFNLFSSREFTHRVKSVSMAKFTAQEVSALQEGGNQVPILICAKICA